VVQKTYKFKLYPTKKQVEKLELWLDLTRELYNGALQERRDAYRINGISLNYYSQNLQLKEIKTVRPEFADINSHVLQDCLDKLHKSFNNFFRRVKKGEKPGFPRFKGKNFFNSFSFPKTRYKIVEGNKYKKINLSRFGEIKFRVNGKIKLDGELRTATIKRVGQKWFVCIVAEFKPEKLEPTNRKVGIDVGLKSFAVLSDGQTIDNPRHLSKFKDKLRIAQRRLSRRKKGSNRRRKAIKMVGRIYEQVANSRSDFIHKTSRRIINENDLIAIEKLSIKGLASGMLAKSVLDVSWGNFFEKLSYKAENAGRTIVRVNPAGTSQTCICGNNVPKKLADRVHNCESCGIICDRDFMSAQVILKSALNQSVQSLT
jgi:putative transposase